MSILKIIALIILATCIVPVCTAGGIGPHPYMLFSNIDQTPGYQYNTQDPWNTWEGQVMSSAKTSLKRDFSAQWRDHNRIFYRAEFARDLGLAYQITKDTRYSMKAREALLNMEKGDVTGKPDRAVAAATYSLAYDWIQPTLDSQNDTIIRDKLATLADTAYKDLNNGGTSTNYVSFADIHGQTYPSMGVVSAALMDYTNPNHLPLSSTPADWHRVGTDYLFVNDQLHSFGRSMFSFGFDVQTGKNVNGAYKHYFVDDFALWFQVSNRVYGENLLEKYPAAKKAFLSEEWESLPNEYSNNYVTNSNIGWIYQRGIISLLPDSEKSLVLNHLDRIDANYNNKLLPYSLIIGGPKNGDLPGAVLYSVYGDYKSIPRSFPTTTSHLDSAGIYQIFRSNWNDDADWLSLITWDYETRSNRDMGHYDQLSLEYYSRGDLLLADAGEQKTVLDKYYGSYEIHHNTIAIENPRTPFPISPWSGNAAKGIYKGNANGVATPAVVDNIVQVPWMELMKSHVTISKLNVGAWNTYQSLTSPINYERTILFPEKEYFVVIDRLQGTEPWTYRNIFRPTSLSITPTADTNGDNAYAASEVGHVNGDLTVGSTPFNWQDLTYKTETDTGTSTDSITWSTTSPYGKHVTLDMVTVPASEVLVIKHVGRVAGETVKNEVYSPLVYLKPATANNLYRVTALLSRYDTEEQKTVTTLPVTGTGNALAIHSSKSDDYIYTGSGKSQFGGFSTDADTIFVRKTGDITEVVLLQGTFLEYRGKKLIDQPEKPPAALVQYRGDTIVLKKISDAGSPLSTPGHTPAPTLATGTVSSREQPNTDILTDFSNFLKEIFTILSGKAEQDNDFDMVGE